MKPMNISEAIGKIGDNLPYKIVHHRKMATDFENVLSANVYAQHLEANEYSFVGAKGLKLAHINAYKSDGKFAGFVKVV